MNNKISSNSNISGRNGICGKVYFASNSSEYPGTNSTYKKLRNDSSYGKKKERYGSKGKFRIER